MGLAAISAAGLALCGQLAGCCASVATAPGAEANPVEDYALRRDTLVREAPESDLRAWEASPDWRARLTALDVRAWQDDPAVAALAWAASPIPTRLGLRFADPRLATPAAVGPMLARLAWGEEPAEVRQALAEGLARTGGEWATTIIQMWPEESDAAVRATVVASSRHAPVREAEALLRLGFGDGEAGVRESAVRTVPWLLDHQPLDANVVGALGDANAVVRAEAARAAGLLLISDAWRPLVVLLSDGDARVRFQALRALQRLDAANAAALPEVAGLKRDADLRVQKAATEMAQ